MPTDDKYNGWTNRETWAAHLYISNHPFFAYHCRDRDAGFIRHLIADLDGDEALTALRDVGSLWRVNWDEIAKALIGDGQ